MRILVLGATGFIGGQIARVAVEAGYEVRAFCRPHSQRWALQGLQVEPVIGDLEAPASLVTAMKGCQAVIHAAGYYPSGPAPRARHVERARRQIRHVLDAARQAGIRRLIYTSSISTIGPIRAGHLGSEQDFYWPGQMAHPYWDCKWVQEQAVLSADGLETITLIPGAVFGPGDVKPTTGTALLAMARLGTRVTLTGRINVVDVRDVAQAHVAALTRGHPGERYLLGGHNVTVQEFVAEAARVLGRPGPVVALPMELIGWPLCWMARLAMRAGLPGSVSLAYLLEAIQAGQWVDSTKAQQELGFRLRPLAETLADAVAWFRAHGAFDRPLRSLAMMKAKDG
ncbi:MAG: NAD(P)H-binding protein [Anaerolineae bacterium]|nr:NAD(P)H-binding protein [Anaerolineae bacterium]MDW8098612.1 NAD(P)H-binding protein [Anaerolineae bacterium]